MVASFCLAFFLLGPLQFKRVMYNDSIFLLFSNEKVVARVTRTVKRQIQVEKFSK